MEPMSLPSVPNPAADPHDAGGGSGASRATRMEPARERELVGRAGTDADAFGELYDFYLPRIYGFVHRRTRERTVTEDLTATTFERALAALDPADVTVTAARAGGPAPGILSAPDRRASRNRPAATIGPIVCDEDGPMPILKTSKTLRNTAPDLIL